jgi:hypothetical protein
MNCPRCGERTRVINSRHADSFRRDGRHRELVTFGHKWTPTPDWVARIRICSCGWRSRTLELLESTLVELLTGDIDADTK